MMLADAGKDLKILEVEMNTYPYRFIYTSSDIDLYIYCIYLQTHKFKTSTPPTAPPATPTPYSPPNYPSPSP